MVGMTATDFFVIRRNSVQWKGETARRVETELNEMVMR
jgi:hypothetical protein